MSGLVIFLGLSIAAITAGGYSSAKQQEALASMGRPLAIPLRAVVIQSSLLSVLASAIGVAAIYLGDIPLNFINSESSLDGIEALTNFLMPTVTFTFIAFLGHMLIYYAIFRRRINPKDIILGEELRLKMGRLARILQGGIVEEVQFRWGLMTLVAWLSLRVLRLQNGTSIWLAIITSACIFGGFHLISSFQLGMNKEAAGVALTLIDNIWGGVFFAWLFWKYGLLAAMISHAMLHLLWSPIEKNLLDRYKRNQAT